MLIPILSRRLRSKTASQWSRELVKAGVAASPVYSLADVKKDAHVKYRRILKPAEPGMFSIASPIRLLEEDRHSSLPAPRLGQHTSQVLRELG